MLDWLSGKSDDSSREEPPETPAHLFAVKAFKSALFGTPAPPEHVPNHGHDDEDVTDKGSHGKGKEKEVEPVTRNLFAAASNLVPSPAKGILLTPGTIGARRKTVSFGACKEQTDSDLKIRKTSLDETRRADPGTDVAQRNTRRALFGGSTKQESSEASKPSAGGEIRATNRPLVLTASAPVVDDLDATDVTIDLQQPRSFSGKHWMEAYHRDHNTSKEEMKKLIRYSQVAKEHSARRDRETVRIKGKLQKSEDRVRDLEAQVRKFRTTTSTKTSETENSMRKLETGDPQIVLLEEAAKDAMEKAAKLERENEKFKKTILRVKEEMCRYEERHKTWVEQRKRKDDRYAEQRKSLREKIVLQKTQYTELLRQTEEEAERDKASLRREIEFLRGEVTSLSPSKYALLALHGHAATHGKVKQPEVMGKPLKFEQLRREEPDLLESSPTILDNHLAKALGKTSVSEDTLPRMTAVKSNAQAKTQGSKFTRPISVVDDQDDATDSEPNDLPVLTTNTSKNLRSAVRTRKANGVRVKSRQGLGGKTSSGLPPDREAAARLRIAQRSVEKQRDTRFLLDKGKENRQPLMRQMC